MVYINLWNPVYYGLLSALLISFILGLIHGITPDEHTWPITFAYSVGSYSTKKGAKTGLIFSLGFTIQRAALSELSYFALAGIFTTSFAFGFTYIIVGLAMFLAALYIIRRGEYYHFHYLSIKLAHLLGIHGKNSRYEELELRHKVNPAYTNEKDLMKPVPINLAFVHGIIAGFGFGAFALILYTTISPAMPSPYIGWVPGAAFGLGTMVMQILFGSFFGKLLYITKKLTQKGVMVVGKTITEIVLKYGGLAFVVVGAAILIFPQLMSISIITNIKIHNLDSLGVGFFLVVVVVAVLGYLGYKIGLKRAKALHYTSKA
ncbi:MAG: hypothetical protein M1433_01340 [Candidatus Parvarchaeota archaeon]|nr:hypothetical protein [Candidatus Parvarchaeota archaeon]